MDQSNRGFAFADRERTFTCRVETSRRTPTEAWWWFSVSTESYQRHAPFRAATTDTPGDVQARVVAYYERILADRERPRLTRPTWAQRKTTPAPQPAPAPVETSQ